MKSKQMRTILLSLASVAELADALDLGSSVERREGSSPSARTIYFVVSVAKPHDTRGRSSDHFL